MTSIQYQEAEETRQMYQEYIIANYEKPSAEFSEGINERFIEACEVENRYSFGDDTDTPSLLTAEPEENDGWTTEECEGILRMLSGEGDKDSDDETVIFESESDEERETRIRAEELEETEERNKQHEILMGKSLKAASKVLGELLNKYEFPSQSIETLSDLAEEYLYAHDMDILDALALIQKTVIDGLGVDEALMCSVQSCLMTDDEDEECEACGTTCLDHTSNKGRGSEYPCEECGDTRCKNCPCECEELALCKNCDPTYTGKKDPCCITMGRNCGKGLPHITETEVFAGLEKDDALGLSYKEDPKPIHTKITATPTLTLDKSEKSYGTKKQEIIESRRALKNKIRVFEDKMIEKRETQTKDNWMGMKPLKKELAAILDAIMEEECKAGDGWVLRWKDAIEGRYDELFGKAKKQTTKKSQGVFGAKTDEIFKYMGEWEDKMDAHTERGFIEISDWRHTIKKELLAFDKYINDKRRKNISQESKDKWDDFKVQVRCRVKDDIHRQYVDV